MPRLRGSDAWQHELTQIVIRWGKMPRLRGSDALQHELTHIVIRWGKMPRLRGSDALSCISLKCPGYGGLMRFCLCFESELTQIGLPLTSDLLSELVLYAIIFRNAKKLKKPDGNTSHRAFLCFNLLRVKGNAR